MGGIMKRDAGAAIILAVALFLLALTVPCGCHVRPAVPGSTVRQGGGGRAGASPAELTVSAASSLSAAMEEIKALYERESGTVLVTNYGSSGALQQQIEQGAPVDIFLSAAPQHMDILQQKGLIDAGSRVELLENAVVLIVPRCSEHRDRSGFQFLLDDSVRRLAICEPQSSPAGRYAMEVLTDMELWEPLQKKVVLCKDVRQVLTYVETGNVDAGIVYVTDARSSEEVIVAAAVPEDSHTAVTYPAAIVEGSGRKEAAEKFMAFLKGDRAARVFEEYGFMLHR